jgi:isochorismate pyruvate lyase
MDATKRSPENCRDLTECRVEIDRIDRAMVECIAERLGYVERVWQLKLKEKMEAHVPWRAQQVIDKVRAVANEKGVPPDLCEALWRQMMGWIVQYEEEKIRQEIEGKTPGITS